MTTTTERAATLSTLVAAEIRAWLGRLDVRPSELARRMGENDQWLSIRLKGKTPINVNDLQRIAEALGVSVLELLPSELRSGGSGTLNRASIEVPRKADPRPVRHLAPRPFGPPRRDRNRPVSAIPATQRRPKSTRPGERAIAV